MPCLRDFGMTDDSRQEPRNLLDHTVRRFLVEPLSDVLQFHHFRRGQDFA